MFKKWMGDPVAWPHGARTPSRSRSGLVYHAFPLVAGDQEQEEEKEEAPQRSSRRGFVA